MDDPNESAVSCCGSMTRVQAHGLPSTAHRNRSTPKFAFRLQTRKIICSKWPTLGQPGTELRKRLVYRCYLLDAVDITFRI